MTLNQLQTLTIDEVGMTLHVLNVIAPVGNPPMEFEEPRHLTFIKHKFLVQRLVDCFQQIKPEAHPIYVSLMEKLGVKVEINQVPPTPPPTVETATTGSV